jgi:hypothetical protein
LKAYYNLQNKLYDPVNKYTAIGKQVPTKKKQKNKMKCELLLTYDTPVLQTSANGK